MEEQKPTNTQFSIQKIYHRDVSFETANVPQAFKTEWKPDIQLELNTSSNKIDDKVYEVVLALTVTGRNNVPGVNKEQVEGSDKPLEPIVFIAEIKQAGIFLVDIDQQAQLASVLGSFCPNILFPYARERISNLISHGGFPQILLAPINFDALFAQAMKDKEMQTSGVTSH